MRASLEPVAPSPPTKTKKSKSRNGVDGANTAKEEKAKRKKTKPGKEDKPVPEKAVNLNDDLDFWLSASNGNDAKEKKVTQSVVTIGESVSTNDPKKSVKSKKDKKSTKENKDTKEKKDKKAKKDKKSSKKDEESLNNLLGLETTPVNVWKPLVEDKHLVMVFARLKEELIWKMSDCFYICQKYRVVAVPQDEHQVLIPLQLHNRSSKLIHTMNFNVVDSASARLCRGPHELDGVELPHQLDGHSRVEIPLAFSIEDTLTPHNLRGVLTYMTQVNSRAFNSR